ncbi:MAG: hypothetical protein ACLUSP_03700 [Christensenellales bacterium]
MCGRGGNSSIYLSKGETASIRDLLYGLMLQSGNDCAVALAVTTAGSVEKVRRAYERNGAKMRSKRHEFRYSARAARR